MPGRCKVRKARAAANTPDRPNDLPEGSGDEESPEELRAKEVFQARMTGFEEATGNRRPRSVRRHRFSDYTERNCEECWGTRVTSDAKVGG